MSWQSGATDVEMECEELEIKRGKKNGERSERQQLWTCFVRRGAPLVGLNDPMSWKVPGGMDDGKLDGSHMVTFFH